MDSIDIDTLQKKFGFRFFEARKFISKVERLKHAAPQSKIKFECVETQSGASLVITLEFEKREQQEEVINV